MRSSVKTYYDRLKKLCEEFDDQNNLDALADIDDKENRARELRIYREQQKTIELLQSATDWFKQCSFALTDPEKGKNMTVQERQYCFACMDFCRLIFDTCGEDPEKLEKEVDELVKTYYEETKRVFPNHLP